MSELQFRAAEPAELERLRAAVTQQGAAMSARLAAHLRRPRYRPAWTRLALRGDAIVGALLLGSQRLRLGAATIDAGVLEAWWLAEPGEQVRLGLLGDCLGALVAEQLPLALLRGLPAQYEPLGFARSCFHCALELPALALQGASQLQPAAPADLADLAALYAESYAGGAPAHDRAAPDWRELQAGTGALVLADRRGRLVGYAVGRAGQPSDTLAVTEAAAADAGAARDLLAGLRAWAAGQGILQLSIQLAPEHRLVQAALQAGGALVLRAYAGDQPAPLAGVVDLLGTLAALAPELERRLALSRYADWSGSLRVETAEERITLAFTAGRAEVIDGTRPADLRLRKVELPALAQLCLGYRAAADLRATGGLACDDTALGLVDALFPALTPVALAPFWGDD